MVDDAAANVKINTYDKGSGKFTESMTLPAALAASTLFVGKSYDFYVAGDDGIYGANLGSDALAPVVNFVNSDLDVQGIVRVIEIEDGEVFEMINPVIVKRKGHQEQPEGCLSIPGEAGITRRPMHVTVRAQDRNGNEVEYSGSDLLARAFCHELDHLDGKVFIDRAEYMLEDDE